MSGPVTSDEAPRAWLGVLPPARRDQEHLRHLLALQRRLRDVNLSPRAVKAVVGRTSFAEALTWLDVHGEAPDLVERWRALREHPENLSRRDAPTGAAPARRRRRRRGPRMAPQG
jgi:hypothetical protein